MTIAALLAETRKRLVETGTRNRLIHVNRSSSKGYVLNVINERADDVFKILKISAKKMRFGAKGVDDVEDEDNEFDLELKESFDESRYTDNILEVNATPKTLPKKLLKIASNARIAEEEQGINVLYLAIGFLRWFEDDNSNVLRESPLILLPVQLIRNQRTSSYDLECSDEDIVTNLPLQERLKGDFGISLPEIDDNEDFSPSMYFEEVAQAISGKERWTIDIDGIQLGFFSFAKLLMLRDLDPDNWPNVDLTNNPILKGLLADGFDNQTSIFDGDEKIDDVLSVSQINQVIDADSSQTKVIEEVLGGLNLVTQGPPGTGKSQTITNILAAAAYSGKKVLFVAEKMAALDVVHQRMVKVGLSDLCLELHSRNANKKHVLGELAVTLSKAGKGTTVLSGDEELSRTIKELNKISDTLHCILPERDYSPYMVLSKLSLLMGEGYLPCGITEPKLEQLSLENIDDLQIQIKEYFYVARQHYSFVKHPLYGVKELNLQPYELPQIAKDIESCTLAYDKWRNYTKPLSNLLDEWALEGDNLLLELHNLLLYIHEKPVTSSETLSLCFENRQDTRLVASVQNAMNWTAELEKRKDIVHESIWVARLLELRNPIAEGVNSWISRTFGGYRKASNTLKLLLKVELPSTPAERLTLLDNIISANTLKTAFDDDSAYLQNKLSHLWAGTRTDFTELVNAFDWLDNSPSFLDRMSKEQFSSIVNMDLAFINQNDFELFDTNLRQLSDALVKKLALDLSTNQTTPLPLWLSQIGKHLNEYPKWAQLSVLRERLEKLHLTKFVQAHDDEMLTEDTFVPNVLFSIYEQQWAQCRSQLVELDEIGKVDRHKLVEAFIHLEKSKTKQTRDSIKSAHLNSLPKGASGEMGLLRGEMAKKRKHKSIRYLMTHAGKAIQKIKPIFLMSPISVAQYLPPETLEFDILVIDEASQVKPEDALGSIVRAKQIVVVGDQKQLPPTSFFDRLTDDGDEEDDESNSSPLVKAADMESILSLCEARGMNQRMLEWHYRSRDPSLITVSNLEFYNNQLILPPNPSPNDAFLGLSLCRVPGAYASRSKGVGRAGTNKIEAEYIVKRLVELANEKSEYSVGIVTFSKAQADMISEVLEFTRRDNTILDEFLKEDKVENVFVKNIENVQGDERDVILVSVGYGPHAPNERLTSMSFGPINSEGGERRLNVLFSRSRIACQVFSSFAPADIDLNRTQKLGPRVLKTFLQFAENRYLPDAATVGGDPDSDFEVDVANEIRKMGYAVDYQVGSAGFKIDLGIRKDNQSDDYILAIECDGATYHSALWARERDRLRQEVLEAFGWKFHRIWSTDWFYRRASELERLEKQLAQASNLSIGIYVKGANNSPPPVHESKESIDISSLEIAESEITVPIYTKSNISIGSGCEPHETPVDEIVEALRQIVDVEGPIHIEELARRYASAHGKSRVGNRILEAVKNGVKNAVKNEYFQCKDEFVATEGQIEKTPVRDRSKESGSTVKPDYISNWEIVACARLASHECGEMSKDELCKTISKIFGFKRSGSDLQDRIGSVLDKDYFK